MKESIIISGNNKIVHDYLDNLGYENWNTYHNKYKNSNWTLVNVNSKKYYFDFDRSFSYAIVTLEEFEEKYQDYYESLHIKNKQSFFVKLYDIWIWVVSNVFFLVFLLILFYPLYFLLKIILD